MAPRTPDESYRFATLYCSTEGGYEEGDRQRADTGDATGVPSSITYGPAGDGDSRVAEPPAGTAVRQELPRRFHASVTLHPDRVGRDGGRSVDRCESTSSALPGARLNA